MGGAYSLAIYPELLSSYTVSLFAINPSNGALTAYPIINKSPINSTSYSFVTNMYLDAASNSIFFSTGVRSANYNEMPGRERFHCKVTFVDSTYTPTLSSVCYDTTLGSDQRTDGFEMMYESGILHFTYRGGGQIVAAGEWGSYSQLNMLTGAYNSFRFYQDIDSVYAGVFTSITPVSVLNPSGQTLLPGYFVAGISGTKNSFNQPFSATKMSALVMPYLQADTCSTSAYGTPWNSGTFLTTPTVTTTAPYSTDDETYQGVGTAIHYDFDIDQTKTLGSLCVTCSMETGPVILTPGTPLPPDQNYTISNITSQVIIPAFTENSNYCTQNDIIYAMSVIPPTGYVFPGLITYDSVAQTINYDSFIVFDIVSKTISTFQNNPDFAGNYTITITAIINSTGIVATYNASIQFNLTVRIPTCLESLETTISIDRLSAPSYNYTLQSPNFTVDIATTMTVTGSTYCSLFDIKYSLGAIYTPPTPTNNNITWITVDPSTGVVPLFQTDASYVGNSYQINILCTITTASGTFQNTGIFYLNVIPTCNLSTDIISITPGTSPGNLIYILGSAKQFVTISNFTENAAYCTSNDIFYQISIAQQPSGVIDTKWIEFDKSTMMLQYNQSSCEFAGDYSLKIDANITNTAGVWNGSESLNLTVIQPTCADSTSTINLSGKSPGNQKYQIGSGYQEIKIPEFDQDCCFCSSSDIVYEMSVSPSANFIQFDPENKVIYYQQDSVSEGDYNITIKAIIQNQNVQPFVGQIDFILTVSSKENITLPQTAKASCLNTENDVTIEPVSSLSNKEYVIGTKVNNKLQIAQFTLFEDGDVKFCKQSDIYYTLTVTPFKNGQSTNFISFDKSKLIVDWSTVDPKNAGSFDVRVKACIQRASPVCNQQSFKLTTTYDQVPQTEQSSNKTETIPDFKKMTISRDGIVRINFNTQMFSRVNISLYNSSVLDIALLDSNYNLDLSEKFTWAVLSFKSNQLQIQLEFQNPIHISLSGKMNRLKVTVIEPDFFFSEKKTNKVLNLTTITSSIPPLLSNNKLERKMLSNTITAATTVTKGVIISNAAASLVTSGSLSQLWGAVNALQVVDHFTEFNIYKPANVDEFFDFMGEVARLNLLDLKPIYYTIFPFMKQEDLNDEPGPINLIIRQIGSYFLTFLLFAIILVLYFIFQKLKDDHIYFQNIYEKIRRILFWNGTIRNIFESYLDFTLAALSQLYYSGFQWDNGQQIAASISMLVGLIFYIIIPIIITVYLIKNYRRFRRQEFLDMFGEVITDLNWRSPFSANQIACFCYRRLILVLLLVFLPSYTFAQIQLITFTQQILITIFGLSECIRDRQIRRLEFFNEVMVMIMIYHLYLLTDFVDDPDIRYQIGYSYIGCCLFMLAVNLFFIMVNTYKDIRITILKKRKEYRNQKHAKLQKQRANVLAEIQKLKLQLMEEDAALRKQQMKVNVQRNLEKKQHDTLQQSLKTDWVKINSKKSLPKSNKKLQIIQEEEESSQSERQKNAQQHSFGNIVDEENPSQVIMPKRIDPKKIFQIGKSKYDSKNTQQKKHDSPQQFVYEDQMVCEGYSMRVKKLEEPQKIIKNLEESFAKDMEVLTKTGQLPPHIIEQLKNQDNSQRSDRQLSKQHAKEEQIITIDTYDKQNKKQKYQYDQKKREKQLSKLMDAKQELVRRKPSKTFIKEIQSLVQKLTDLMKIVQMCDTNPHHGEQYFTNFSNEMILLALMDAQVDLLCKIEREIPKLQKAGESVGYLWHQFRITAQNIEEDRIEFRYEKLKQKREAQVKR